LTIKSNKSWDYKKTCLREVSFPEVPSCLND